MNIKLIKAGLYGFLLNALFCFLPIGAFLAILGGFLSLRYYKANLKPKQFVIFGLISSLINGLLIAYLVTLFFFASLGKPLSQAWLQIEFLESLLRESGQFRWGFFGFNLLIVTINNFFGCFLAFKLKIGHVKPPEEKLLAELEIKDLEKYLD